MIFNFGSDIYESKNWRFRSNWAPDKIHFEDLTDIDWSEGGFEDFEATLDLFFLKMTSYASVFLPQMS